VTAHARGVAHQGELRARTTKCALRVHLPFTLAIRARHLACLPSELPEDFGGDPGRVELQ
jgi:hypothetical protein